MQEEARCESCEPLLPQQHAQIHQAHAQGQSVGSQLWCDRATENGTRGAPAAAPGSALTVSWWVRALCLLWLVIASVFVRGWQKGDA